MDRQEELAERIGTVGLRRGLTVGVVESLTGGLIATRLAAATDASRWFRGAGSRRGDRRRGNEAQPDTDWQKEADAAIFETFAAGGHGRKARRTSRTRN